MSLTTPTNPIQLEEAFYPVEELYTLPRLTRDLWENKFGIQPEPFNPDLRPKNWADQSLLEKGLPLDSEVHYTVWDRVKRDFSELTITVSE